MLSATVNVQGTGLVRFIIYWGNLWLVSLFVAEGNPLFLVQDLSKLYDSFVVFDRTKSI